MPLEAVLNDAPNRVLEVGCGEGELAERLTATVAEVVAVDQSPRMVELTRARGVDAHVADVQQLPFPDASFDAVLAAWMLYHVPDLDRGLSEVARVLRPGARLVATTNGADHLAELLALGGIERWELPFEAENGAEILGRHFSSVQRQDAHGTVTFRDIELVRSYFASSERLTGALDRLPAALDGPLVARRLPGGLRRDSVMRPAELIEQKRNGGEHDPAELAELILAYARDEVPDYQLAAWCMAVYFQGLTAAETHALTDAMIRSGETLDLGAALGRKVLDKHSTGGVGDKTSIAVGPIVAACGVPLGKMSGRGLGHTGGTLDKLESIPGFRVELTTEELVAQLREVGMAIVGQTANLVPADKKLYALRDVTATVDIVPLIASSIMSKKLAAGAQAIVLDVKVGDGAFMKTLDDARVLAEVMREIGTMAGREVTCLLTDMEQPLGRAVGNALEVHEARDTVRGDGPADFTELVLDAAARLLAYSDLGIDVEEGRRRAEAAVQDGSALDLYERWIRAQGGDPDPGALEQAPVRRVVPAPRDGVVTRLGAFDVGVAALELGAGRRTKADPVDHAVGILCFAKRGDTVLEGDDLAEVHARDDDAAERAAAAVLAAYEIGDHAPPDHGIVLDVVA